MGSFDFNAIWQFVILLSLLVVVHEYGHFLAARAFGVKVHEFSVGFGPLIGKFNWKDVQYSFRWVLLGGFCKIAGMDVALEGGAEKTELKPGESFIDLPLWKRITVIAAGPFFNLFLAMLLIFVTASVVGLPNSVSNPPPIIEQAIPGSPAFEAGFRPGDKILSINQSPVKEWLDIPRLIKSFGGSAVTIKIERRGDILVKKVTPIYNPVEKRYVLGINGMVADYKTVPVLEAAKMAVTNPWIFISDTIKGLIMMLRGEIKGGGMGPIGMVSWMEQNTKLPIYYTLYFTIIISISLFFFNLLPLPLPLLDGGWIAIMILERILRREFTAEQKAVAQLIGLTMIAFLFIVVTYGDLTTMFKRFFGG